MPSATARSWSVRIISRPVRSPTWARRGCEWPPNGRWRIRPSRRPVEDGAPQLELADAVRRLRARGARPSAGCSGACRRPSCRGSGPATSPSAATWPSAAATPPSAMTVWALPSSDLQTRPTSAPAALASIAARRPGPAGADDEDVVRAGLRLRWARRWRSGHRRLEVDRRVGDDARAPAAGRRRRRA